MSDIVERLRGENWWLNVSGEEAAAHIDTLHAHLNHYRDLVAELRARNAELVAALAVVREHVPIRGTVAEIVEAALAKEEEQK